MELIENGKKRKFILDSSKVSVSTINHAGSVEDAIESIDETLKNQQEDINKLKSNMKYIYSYGGVGGNGRGGSGGGQSGTPSLFVSLGKRQIQSGSDNVIVLNGVGTYMLEGNLSNSGGETFNLTVGYGSNINRPQTYKLDSDRRWKITTASGETEVPLNLTENGEIEINLYDAEWSQLLTIRQSYVVITHTFDSKFMYTFNDEPYEFIEPYEYFIGNQTYNNPYIDVSFKISISNVSNIAVEYHIGDTDNGQGTEHFTLSDITDNHFKIYIGDLIRGGIPFTDETNAGTYTVSVSLSYDVNAKPIIPDTRTFQITLIPNDLYINVRNTQNIVYDTFDELENAIQQGSHGIPEKNLTVGSYASFYCKVYEGPMRGQPRNYVVTFKVYDYVDGKFVLDATKTQNEDGFKEQIERINPINVVFETPGIKKLEFSTIGQKTDDHSGEQPMEKYIYVKQSDTNRINWYPSITQSVFYFRANSGSETYSKGFPQFASTDPLELSETGRPQTLSDPSWVNPQVNNPNVTILSFGLQYSSVNAEGSEIFRTYERSNSTTADLVLYSDKLFSKKICIPGETNFNKSEKEQYHLVQIACCKIGVNSSNSPQYATYLYIDGRLESNKAISETDMYLLQVGKIVLNNVNVIYNLISLQYAVLGSNTLDGLIYQYYLAYRDRMITPGEVTSAERTILDNMSSIKFNGKDVIVSEATVYSISKQMPIPTLMLNYMGGDTQENYDAFKEALFKGYANASDVFKPVLVDVYWTPGMKANIANNLSKIEIPKNITDVNSSSGNIYTGNWYVELQGTSTMRNKIKNFSLSIVTANNVDQMEILMSPNYDSEDSSTFLPESVWTLKADIADSAHANNTAVGKFVNENCTRFSSTNGISLPADVSKYIKNTLEGFPFLMFFKVGEEVYYLGVYNFNMGRGSYYNLGYHTAQDTLNMIDNIAPNSSENSPFKFSVGRGEVIPTLAIGEVQDNFQEFDFHQYDYSVLFQDDNSTVTKMFGKDSKMTGRNAKATLSSFVKSVSRAGAYCFASINKKPVCSNANGPGSTTGKCVNRYSYDSVEGRECVPDVAYQFTYNASDEKVWSTVEGEITFDGVRGDIDNLLQCIYETNSQGQTPEGFDHLDFTSVSEYYTVCMAFGLVDSILKNLNVKSWDGNRCYIAFYDMDCAFGENNAGEEIISYLAATDYWYSPTTSGYVEQAKIIYDYWNKSIGPGFDYTSSYLFAIAKYAQAICYKYNLDPLNEHKITLTNYPQQFWAKLRKKGAALENAKSFIKKYFASGIGQIPSYLASLNYQVKYLYKGSVLDNDGNLTNEKFFANEHAFNGSRLEKVTDWMNKRLHFLDAVFNVQGIPMPIGNDYMLPYEDKSVLDQLASNPDVVILTDMFSTQENNTVIMSSNARPVQIWAPKNTPFVVARGSSSEIYLLSAETGSPNTIQVNVNTAEGHRFLGSTEFTDLNMVEPFITNAKMIYSDRITRIVCGSGEVFPTTDGQLSIQSASVKVISLPISTYKGNLQIISDTEHSYGQVLNEIDVHGSGFTGSWENLKNLTKLNISSVNDERGTISISQCPLLTGENCNISGTSDNPTTLDVLTMTGVSGKFHIENTRIQTMSFTSKIGSVSEFEIDGDTKLNTLTLAGFKSIKISNCPNLEKLYITDDTENINNKCEVLIVKIPKYTYPDGSAQQPIEVFNTDVSTTGIFDFTRYSELKTLGFSGCSTIKVIKIPNHKVSIDEFSDNINLEFVDTQGRNSCIEITKDRTFYNCPGYGMRQSWGSVPVDNGKDITTSDTTRTLTETKYTHICIKPKLSVDDVDYCKTLSQTFMKPNGGTSNYLDKDYTNEFGQIVRNVKIKLKDVKYFINNIIAGEPADDAYIGDGTDLGQGVPNELNIVYDATQDIDYGDDCRENIESFQGCFYRQDGINMRINATVSTPDLSGYRSLTNISAMYSGTEIEFISKDLLSLPADLNKNSSDPIIWDEFIGTNTSIRITRNAFENISYRINGFESKTFSIYSTNNGTRRLLNTVTPESDSDWFSIEWILCPRNKQDELYCVFENDNFISTNGEFEPFEHIDRFNAFSINTEQWIDYRKLFEFCPNIRSLNGFLNTDLSKSKIDGILRPNNGTVKLNNLEIISGSFNHTGDVDTLWGDDNPGINLYTFFDWTNTTLYNKISSLFESDITTNKNAPGFSIKKYISNSDFEYILNNLHRYQKIDKLMNIFSYCTINGYDPDLEIKLEGDMNKVQYINALFYKCKSDNNNPLCIRRSFFEHLKKVVSMINTFYGVYFDHMLSYDFFCKCTLANPVPVKVKVDGVIPSQNNATLQTVAYGSDLITNMSYCFCNAKFVGCKSWFDINDVVDSEGHTNDYYKPAKDVVTKDGDSSYTTYYKREDAKDVEYKVTNYAVTDTLNNITNYVEINYMPNTSGSSETRMGINNHNITNDLDIYNNTQEGRPFSQADIDSINMSSTYCCLPPDIFHACTKDCNFTSVFANTNIIGIIPQHLVMKCDNGIFENMFLNTNILPNLVYHYDKRCDASYIDSIEDLTKKQEYIDRRTQYLDFITATDSQGNNLIPIDEETIMTKTKETDPDYVLSPTGDLDPDDAIVLFRNSDGELRRRRPIATGVEDPNGEYSKSIFVYVPQGYTKNSNLNQAFTFRYNLPPQVDMYRTRLSNDWGIDWPAGTEFGSNYSPEEKPWLWPHYTQYFFMLDESIFWDRLQMFNSPFITDSKDIDFKTETARTFSTDIETNKNVWWNNKFTIVTPENWYSMTNGVMNIFLNLCGGKNTMTGNITDLGCPIGKSSSSIGVNSFISDSLVAFLNGRIFTGIDVGRFDTVNASKIVRYNLGCARNIKFPQFNQTYKDMPTVFLEYSQSIAKFYTFMFLSGLVNYQTVYDIKPGNFYDGAVMYKII